MARPATGKYEPDKMVEIIEDYLQTCLKKKKVPIFKECCVKAGWNSNVVHQKRALPEYKSVDEEIQRLMDCKEYMLERLGLEGKVEKTMAVFSLKQLGWTDSSAVDVNANCEGLKIKLVTAE